MEGRGGVSFAPDAGSGRMWKKNIYTWRSGEKGQIRGGRSRGGWEGEGENGRRMVQMVETERSRRQGKMSGHVQRSKIHSVSSLPLCIPLGEDFAHCC